MEILETEFVPKDLLTKSAKKKKDLDEKAIKNVRKISDFFKTPEKQVEKQRQKSLLQFFGKQDNDEKEKESVVVSSDDVLVNGTDVTTPTNSDKENSEVVDIEVTSNEKGESKPRKKQKNSDNISEECNAGLNLKHADNGKEVTETKRHKKHKKKRKIKDEKAENSLSDSVILLSDSSSSNLQFHDSADHLKETTEEKIEAPAKGKVHPKCCKGKDEESVFDEIGNEEDGEMEMEVDEEHVTPEVDVEVLNKKKQKVVCTNASNEKETNKMLDEEAEHSAQVPCGNDNNDIRETTKDKETLCEDSLDKQEKSTKIKQVTKTKKTKKKKLDTLDDDKNTKFVEKKTVDDIPILEESDQQCKGLENGKKKSKKSTLRGKDMLDLLKEIQSGDPEDKNKKKHKKKHKHHKTKDKLKSEVLEIAISEDNSDGKDEVKELTIENNRKGTSKTDPELCEEASKRVTRRRSKIDTDIQDNDNIDSTLKEEYILEKPNQKGKEDDRSKMIETPKQKRLKSKKKELDKDSLEKSSQQLPHQDTDTVESSKKQKDKDEDIKEMSYTEYLEMVEKSYNNEENVEEMDKVNVIELKVNDDIEMNFATFNNDSEKIEDVVEQDFVSEKNDVKKFFTFMTSTPDREKSYTKAGKVAGKRGRKPKSEKLKLANKVKDDNNPKTEVNEEKKSEIDSDVEVIDVKEETRSQSDGIKCDASCKSLFTSKKTQATLSFGKAGLTVSKAVTKSDEEKPKDKTSGTEKVNEVGKEIDEKDQVKAPPKKRGRKPKQAAEALNASDSSVFATPENVKRKAKRQLEEEESESGDNDDRRRSLRKRYKVEAFQMDADKKTPIKIKLKRCPKSSSSGEDADKSALNLKKVKPTANQTTALALLEKAKRGRMKKHKLKKDKETINLKKHKEAKKLKKNTKKRNASNSSEDSLTRRSSRLEGRCMASMEEVSLENIVISSSDEEGENAKVVKKRGRPKGSKNIKSEIPKNLVEVDVLDNKATPKKDVAQKKLGTPSKNRTPSKKAGSKLAPMFLMGKNKVAEPSPKKPPEDPEVVKQRQQFLMSGVPEALRKQTATRMASQVDADYPPLPRTSHVLQVPEGDILAQGGGVNVWNLKPRELVLRHFNIPMFINLRSRFTGDLLTRDDEKHGSVNRIMNFKSASPISDDMIDLCKGEISSYNTTYPVSTMYKAVKEMKIETERPPPKSESMLRTDMSGILDGCTGMTVIEDDEEEHRKKKKKKSMKLQKKDLKEQKVEEPKVEEKSKVTGSSLLWTEKYCPSKTAEVLGNSGILKKLKTWLTEWKHLLDKEARKARKLLMKKNKGKQPLNKKSNDDMWDDDYSDFDMDSDDSDEDDSLCNTMLLSGPHGCGKTSSVYALALELGFKVHEVNASSCRSGKQILSQLQEATQSHQVSSQGNHTPRKNTALGDKPKPENKMPAAFTNLFKKSAPTDGGKLEDKQEKPGRKRKRNKSDKDSKGDKKVAELKHKSLQLVVDDSNSQSAAKSLNLSSTTLILFDEVDVVFDDDKGFLSAIQSFMSKTKIPIILTSADPGFTKTFDSRYEQIIFKRPSAASITSHLQTISLVENVRTDQLMLAEMAQFYNCDMRRCLLTLQYLLESGGGHLTTCRVIPPFKGKTKNTNLLGLDCENSQSCSQFDSHETGQRENKQVVNETEKDLDNSDDDFVTIKPLRKRRRVLDDDNSNSVDECEKVAIPVSTESTVTASSDDAKNYPLLHSLGLESLISTNSISIADMLSQELKTNTGSTTSQEMICTYCRVKQNSGSDLFYSNLHYILPFSTNVVDMVFKVSQEKCKTKTRQRIRIESDLYDSEASNDASKVDSNVETIADNQGHSETKVDTLKKGSKEENICLAKSLSYFTHFYDTMSSLDVLESVDGRKICDKLQGLNGREVKGTLVAGMGNELAKFPTHCELDLETSRNYCSEIGTRSMCKMYNECSLVKEEVEKLCVPNETFEDDFTLPISRQNEHFTLADSTCVSVPGEYKKACENTVDNLPLASHSHLTTVHLDYLPTLREICKTEQCRQITNTKRRFHHYLDSITLPLKERTISTLATTFI